MRKEEKEGVIIFVKKISLSSGARGRQAKSFEVLNKASIWFLRFRAKGEQGWMGARGQ